MFKPGEFFFDKNPIFGIGLIFTIILPQLQKILKVLFNFTIVRLSG